MGAELEGRTYYAPSLQDWTREYVIISELGVALPLSKYFSLRYTLSNTYDNTPDEDAEKNELKMIVALSWRF